MNDDTLRAQLFSDILRKREDRIQRQIIDDFQNELNFEPIDELMISQSAWRHVLILAVEPKVVFAHPDVLFAHPTTSLYYRGMALLSRKRVAQAATNVTNWEDSRLRVRVRHETAQKVACLYNTIISSIIEGSSDWTLDNGYRNILASMGITLDGMFRNKIGFMAEELVKSRIVSWLEIKGIIQEDAPEIGHYSLPSDTVMTFGTEPDIEFVRNDQTIATIEIKGGRDPAGALERFGSFIKSFAETPSDCINFLVASVIMPEMQTRLESMGVMKVYLLDDILHDGERWDDFTNEVLHYAVRVI
ncbi:MAG: XcyI family restriction endonuclease [Rhodobacteraceae bacterium]|nr:XcyI family restriction endonuclease [Paracoccaceae bacterium]